MSKGGASSMTLPVVTHQSMVTGTDKVHHVICTEFKRAKRLFKQRNDMCARCGELQGENRTSEARVDDGMGIKKEHVPPRKRLLLRFEREQKALAAAAAASWEKDKEEGELEEGEISWSPNMMINKGKRAPRRRRADEP